MVALKRILLVLCLSLVAACGKSSETTNGVPTPVDPSKQGGGNNPYIVPTPTPDPRIPDLSTATALRLVNPTDYSGLEEIANIVYLPLVGDPKIAMKISGADRSNDVTGSVLVAFEDQVGFWGAQLTSFPGTGYRDSSNFDMIFADDELVVRVVGAIGSNNKFDGNVYYKMHVSTDTACRPKTICTTYNGSTTCVPEDPAITASNCRAYIQPGASLVKQLGNFHSTSYSSWVVR